MLFRLEPASREQLLAGDYSASRELTRAAEGGRLDRQADLQGGAASLRSATAAERARGAAPAHVWPGGAAASSAAVAAAPSLARSRARAAQGGGGGSAVALLSSAPASASQAAGCLGDCSGHGQCSRSQCFCDPGYY